MAISSTNPKISARLKLEGTINSLTNREAVCTLIKLQQEYPQYFQDITFSNARNYLIDSIVRLDNLNDILIPALSRVRAEILPPDKFEWLEDDIRLQNNCYEILKGCSSYGFCYKLDSYGEGVLDMIHSILDTLKFTPPYQPISQPQNHAISPYSPPSQYPAFQSFQAQISLDQKSNYLLNVRNFIYQIYEQDNYSKWLKKEDSAQIKWTIRYLENNLIGHGRFDIFSDSINVQRLLVLSFLDLYGGIYNFCNQPIYQYTAEKKLFIDKMKRAWSQQKFRDAGKTKTQYHLPLTKETRSRLDKLAEVKGLSTSAMLDILINEKYQIECLDVEGNEIY